MIRWDMREAGRSEGTGLQGDRVGRIPARYGQGDRAGRIVARYEGHLQREWGGKPLGLEQRYVVVEHRVTR